MTTDVRTRVLVTTQWVEDHLTDSGVKLIEVDVDTNAYGEGHVPGAIGFNWTSQLQDQVRRDIISREALEKLLSAAGVSNDDTVVLYGDNNNWFAAYAFWLLRIYGHEDLKLMDGGRIKWVAEGRPLTKESSTRSGANYRTRESHENLRALRDFVQESVGRNDRVLVDVRSPAEFTGEILAPPGLSETAQRGGHIPGAVSIPWSQAVREDATFKSPDELRALYQEKGVTPDKEAIAYCRIGERSSHTWFVLKYLLGYDRVRNYDGSWTEWGSMIGTPIER
jgi:thiosulfate/3-mercaptopyruvate sulfurtransferase